MRSLTAAGPFCALVAIDLRNVVRDPLLRWTIVLAPALGLLVRLGVPWLAETSKVKFNLELTAYYGLIMSFLPIAISGIYGMVVGFLLLDQRDDQTLTALLVTPLSLVSHLYYRIISLTALSMVTAAATMLAADLTTMTWLQVTLSAAAAATLAPMYALFIGSMAQNKVQGFALVKALGIIVIPSTYAYFAPDPWQRCFAIIPHYWPLKTFWLFDAGDAWAATAHAILGLLSHAVVLLVLTRHFKQVVTR